MFDAGSCRLSRRRQLDEYSESVKLGLCLSPSCEGVSLTVAMALPCQSRAGVSLTVAMALPRQSCADVSGR